MRVQCAWLGALALLLAAGCERENRRFQVPTGAAATVTPASTLRAGPAASTVLQTVRAHGTAGSSQAEIRPAAKNPYEENAYAVSQGKRLFRWYNCSGCHANGGGGMGPALMDDQWIHGHEPEQIVATILQGRPNGMPAFAGRIPEDHVWQIAAYVRSMSGQLRADVSPGRGDTLSSGPPETRREKEAPKKSKSPGSTP